jgi:hypothetical protein
MINFKIVGLILFVCMLLVLFFICRKNENNEMVQLGICSETTCHNNTLIKWNDSLVYNNTYINVIEFIENYLFRLLDPAPIQYISTTIGHDYTYIYLPLYKSHTYYRCCECSNVIRPYCNGVPKRWNFHRLEEIDIFIESNHVDIINFMMDLHEMLEDTISNIITIKIHPMLARHLMWHLNREGHCTSYYFSRNLLAINTFFANEEIGDFLSSHVPSTCTSNAMRTKEQFLLRFAELFYAYTFKEHQIQV